MLRFELGDDEVSDERSDGGGARSGWLYKAGPYEGAEINCWADRSRDAAEGNCGQSRRGLEYDQCTHDRPSVGVRGHRTENPCPFPMAWVSSCRV